MICGLSPSLRLRDLNGLTNTQANFHTDPWIHVAVEDPDNLVFFP